MRTILFTLIALLIALALSSTQLFAQENQEKTKQIELQKKQKQKDLELKKKQQKELDSITEESQAQYDEELKLLIKEQKKAQAESKEDYEEAAGHTSGYDNAYRVRGARVTRPALLNFYDQADQIFSGSGDNTNFTISKNLRNTFTFSNDFEYEVPENVAGLYFDFGAELEAGTLKLTITKPDGKVFQTLSVSPIANVDWNKRYKVKENETSQYSGSWKITISTKEAKGFYELRINSY